MMSSMIAVLRVGPEGHIVGANAAATQLLGPCVGRRCCDLVLARGDASQVVCSAACAAGLANGQAPDRDQRGVLVRGRRCRLTCTQTGAQAVVILQIGSGTPAVGCSQRERACLQLVATGHTTAAIARALGVSSSTVRTHIERARIKLGAATRAEAVARAIGLQLIAAPTEHPPDESLS